MSPTGRTPAENVEEARYHLQFVVTYLDEPATQVATDASCEPPQNGMSQPF